MKKTLFFAALASSLMLAACQKEVKSSGQEEISANFVAEMGLTSKASFDGDGAGIYADQCRLQVYLKKSGASTLIYDETKTVENFKVNFNNIVLLKSQTYDFLFWADNKDGAYYKTDDLHEVTLTSAYVGNDDKRDAFSASIADTTITKSFTRNIYLYRPFAQVNVITTDIKNISDQIPANVGTYLADVTPDKVTLKFTAANKFNVLTEEVSGSEDFDWTGDLYKKDPTKTQNTLSMDYIFASKTKDVIDINFTASHSQGKLDDIVGNFTNVPIQRNYRTNIIGALITNIAIFNVEIKPAWLGEYEHPFTQE